MTALISGAVLEKVTSLSDIQQKLLLTIIELLPFASSLPQQEVYVYTYNIEGQIIYWSKNNLTNDLSQYKSVKPYEVGLWHEVLQKATPVKGYMERRLGSMERLVAFPIIDNGGRCIGGIAIIHTGLTHQESEEETNRSDILADTTYMAMMVPQQQAELYKPLSYHDGLIIFDESGIILYANEAAARLVDLLGFDRRLLNTSVYGGSIKMSWVKQALQMHRGAITEEIYGHIILEQRLIPVSSGHYGKRSLLILKDQTEYRQQEQALLVKNSVIKEIHHRVKNNLQVVAGLLRMEGRRSANEEVKRALQEGVSRIESMALVHELISHYDEDYIEVRTIAEELVRLLRRSMMRPEQQLEFSYEGPSITVSSHRGSYISLILNELISNSLEHGFHFLELPSASTSNSLPRAESSNLDSVEARKVNISADSQINRLTIHTARKDGFVHLTVKDNGQGFPPDFDLKLSSRLGLQIIRNLVENELNGALTFNNTDGAEIQIQFAEEK
ncbi:sensor histidine kinase [uncultured Veillonella sp.]|uniref:sensor histidine kinase n=1 Tax=uncultured Veillonella sp. TaxID=159268 RepID=UPI0025DE5CEE|nr:histidine kinase dimerization/phosphoacceptor domain -containing protein [uncultured Veillonella sp.]MDY3974351.1 histidine kinase dimerization/phosphoacceptor domain -containing protein [Veillonella caviae]